MRATLPLLAVLILTTPAPAAAPPSLRPDYTRDVRPVLARHCFECHGSRKARAALRLDSATALRKGGDSGPAVVPGRAAESLIVKAVLGVENAAVMPPKGPRLSPAEVATLRAWVDGGAAVPAAEAVVAQPKEAHWSFRPIHAPSPPSVLDTAWATNGIDRFILAELERHGVRPSPEADRVTLLRRACLDLTGLPPGPAEVDAFLADSRPDAYERAVDRLLASPHYGERWARHWLDAARYADSNGYSIDSPRAVWKYRDWVIAALNRNVPFDRFTVEQLAGDLLPGATVEQRVATGFQRNTTVNEEGGIDPEQFRVEAVADRADTAGTVFLGLTLGCARCHDHKFDPVSQREYYQVYAFFNGGDDPTLELVTDDVRRRRDRLQAEVARLRAELLALDGITPARLEKWEGGLSVGDRASLPPAIRAILAVAVNGRNPRQEQELLDVYRNVERTRHVAGGLAGPFALAVHLKLLRERTTLEAKLGERVRQIPEAVTTLVLNERVTPRVTTVQLGGDFLRKGEVVTPGVPAVLPPLPLAGPASRLDLARWLVDGRNPLTARVAVNRHWAQFFGLGLVETDNDFGTQGAKPSHPALLDWLACEFTRSGWDVKALHRLIVTTATYRQSSRARDDLTTLDPRNRLLARQNRLRLEAEAVRDAALAASGLLARTVGGPGVFPPQPKGVYSFTQIPRTWTPSEGPDRYRRGMYTFFWRSAPHPGLTTFDAPDATAACTRRVRSNTPLQALTLLNDEAFFECARALAGRVAREAGPREDDRVTLAFRLATARAPTDRERAVLTRVLRQGHGEEAWTALARVLLNLDETITRE